MARRSGSETRKRSRFITVRVTPDELTIIKQDARSHGQSVGDLMRTNVLHIRLRPSRIDRLAVSRLLGELGKIGSNINQIAYHLNAGRPGGRVEDSIESALRDLGELRIACLQALGTEPRRGTDEWIEDD